MADSSEIVFSGIHKPNVGVSGGKNSYDRSGGRVYCMYTCHINHIVGEYTESLL